MNEILSQQELVNLTGYKTNKRILNWLIINRIPFLISGDGRPLVNRNALAYLMGAPTPKPDNASAIELDFNHEGFI